MRYAGWDTDVTVFVAGQNTCSDDGSSAVELPEAMRTTSEELWVLALRGCWR